MRRDRVRRVLAGAFLCLFLSTALVRAAGELTLGVERLSLRDDRLRDLYGHPLGPTLSVALLERPWMQLGLRASYVAAADEPEAAAFMAAAETRMHFIPVRLQWTFRRPLRPGIDLRGGPQVAWAYFRESWTATVPAANLAVDRGEEGTWLGAGVTAALRVTLGRAGHLHTAFEWVWSSDEREAVPGNSRQVSEMSAGWSALSIHWEPPWPAF